MPSRLLPLAVPALLLPAAGLALHGSDALPDPLKSGLETIAVKDLERHMTFLTSADCAGRDTPQPGLVKARDYLVEKHKGFGLESGNPDGSFLHAFDVPAVTWSDDDHLAVVKGQGSDDVEVFLPGVDFVPVRASGSGKVDAEIVFCGYGIVDAAEKYDDFKGVDVKDKVVAVLLHEPRETKKGRAFKGEEFTQHAAITSKWGEAAKLGARAVLVFTDPANHEDLSVLKGEHPRYGSVREERAAIPLVHCSGAVGDRIFGAGKLLEWQKAIDSKLRGAPQAVPGVRVRLELRMRNQQVTVHNVVAAKRGTDPELANDWIVVGGHYDHVGVDPYGRIYHGADDNGSGTSCLLEIAEAIAAPEVAFKRSILIMHFAGEEKGLLGAAAFCQKPLMPAERIFAMVNMDMVGRGRPKEIDAAGISWSNDFAALVRKATSLSGAKLKVGDGGMQFFKRSDQYEFWRVGVPVLFFMEPEEHPDYHQVTDTMEKIVFGKIAETAKVVTGLAWLLSEAEERPKQKGPNE